MLVAVEWMCDWPQQRQLEGTAGVETIILSLSQNNRSDSHLESKVWFGDIENMQAKQNTYNGESHISLPNFGKPSEENREQAGQQGPRTSVRKSNLKVQPHCDQHAQSIPHPPYLHCRCQAEGFGW